MLDAMRDYGWLGVLLLFVVNYAWPFFAEKVWPEKAKRRQRDHEQEIEQLNRKLQIEDKRIEAINTLSVTLGNSIQSMSVAIIEQGRVLSEAIVVQNERISNLSSLHASHNDFVISTLTVMRENMSKCAGAEVKSSGRSKRAL
jgi:hypothetical protein